MLLLKELHGQLQEAPQGLHEVLERADATGRLRIVQQMSINIITIIEKGLLDPVITHGCVPPPHLQIMPTALSWLSYAR